MKHKLLFAILIFVILLALSLFVYLGFKNQPTASLNNHSITSKLSLLNKNEVSAIIVPHYDGAKDKRIELIQKVAKNNKPLKIVIVSVNHFDIGTSGIQTTKKEWQLKTGSPAVSQTLFDAITKDGSATDNENAFLNEHGIANVLPDLYGVFPNAEYLPIIIKATSTKADVDKLYDSLNKNCADCLLVSSIDFSHYNPSSLAANHDEMALKALSKLDENIAWVSETDSPQTFYLATKWAKAKTQYFDNYYHSNSGIDAKALDKETTSYIIGSISADKSSTSFYTPSTTLLFGGDVMMDRDIYHAFKDKGMPTVFDQLGQRVFWGSDISIINNEGPISTAATPDDYPQRSMIFNFPPEAIDALKYLKVNAVSLANNHTSNAGNKGFSSTLTLLKNAGIKSIGGQATFNEESIGRFESEVPISVLTMNLLENIDRAKIVASIKKEKAAGRFVIVFPHWGAEYQPKHSLNQESYAREWIKAGANLIIGSHPHVVQDFEVIDGVPIVYSLGNFVFDQFFSTETQQGLLIGGVITKNDIKLSFYPTEQKKFKPQLETGDTKTARIKQIFDIDSLAGFTKVNSDTINIIRK